MKNILMIAHHFPPSADGSGHLRTLAFTRYLPSLGWRPIVLSTHNRAYSRIDNESLAALPEDLLVVRAFALNAQKHLSIRGSYPLVLAQPDRWSTWWLGAVPAGLSLIRRYRPAVIWSTYPITTAHLVAHTLHRITGLPWIADFRDPISDSEVDANAMIRRTRGYVERKTIRRSTCNVFTTEGAAKLYAERYPWRSPEDFAVVPNGYDEADFADFPAEPLPIQRESAPLRLVHSGVLYREQRDPTAFFEALAELASRGEITPSSVQVVLRGSGHEEYYNELIKNKKIDAFVQLQPAVSYQEALREQYEADGLLLFQGSGYNLQIPAKVYEYLRIGRPIFALTDPGGDTATALKAAGVGTIVEMTSKDAIVPALRQFILAVRHGTLESISPEQAVKYSRRARTEELAVLLQEKAESTEE